MAVWKTVKLTKKGLKLQAKVIAGASILFTKVVVGSGTVPISNLENLNALPNPKQQLDFRPVKKNDDGTVTIEVLLSNLFVSDAYTANMIGFYVMDPDEGEILYCVAQDESGDYIPIAGESPDFSITWYFKMTFGNAETVLISIDPEAYITYELADSLFERKMTAITNPEIDTLDDIYPWSPPDPTTGGGAPITSEEIDPIFQ